tara:strand:- start:162 stop:392 length:231 start_codon:yes stop_codon:yes gene_type:complete
MSKVYLVVVGHEDGDVNCGWFKKKANAERCISRHEGSVELTELIVNGSITNIGYEDSAYEICTKCGEIEEDCWCDE